MRKKLLAILVALLSFLLLSACIKKSTSFNIQFIDVGQGDSALIECDDQYMLIDGGGNNAGGIVQEVLEEKKIRHLNILAISHLHQDHIGGLPKALENIATIDLAISNDISEDNNSFRELEHVIGVGKIQIPHNGDKYKLGSAKIEVLDVAAKDDNDSLVLLVTYGKTRFLFTGDIGEDPQRRIQLKYENPEDKPFKIDLIKIPHHGAGFSNSPYKRAGVLNEFIRVLDPDYAVISVGKNNGYGHPSKETLHLLEQADVKVYRTDENHNIFVKSNGKTVSVESEQ